MAFNVPNWGFIAGGASFPVGYTFNGEDRGAQCAEGKPENPLGNLISDRQQIFRGSDNRITYQFQLTNVGQNTTFMLCGGGLS